MTACLPLAAPDSFAPTAAKLSFALLRDRDAGVVDDDVRGAETRMDLIGEGEHGGAIGDVELLRKHFSRQSGCDAAQSGVIPVR